MMKVKVFVWLQFVTLKPFSRVCRAQDLKSFYGAATFRSNNCEIKELMVAQAVLSLQLSNCKDAWKKVLWSHPLSSLRALKGNNNIGNRSVISSYLPVQGKENYDSRVRKIQRKYVIRKSNHTARRHRFFPSRICCRRKRSRTSFIAFFSVM